jgi:CBS-domain-containing membrane protein
VKEMAFTSIKGNAKRMRIYIGDSDQWRGRPLYSVILEHLKREGLAGATVYRGIAGFGAHSRIHTASILDLSTDLPLVIEVIDTPEKIDRALESTSPMVREGLITVEDVEVISYVHRYLRPLPSDRPVRDIMTEDPLFIRQDQSLLPAWEMMLKQSIKALPVVDENKRVVGLLTHEDFMERAGLNARLAVAQKLDEESLAAEMEILRSSSLTVKDVMSRPAITINQNDPIGLAAEQLVKHSITRLPVLDQQGKLVGMVSRLDLLRQVLDAPGIVARQPAEPAAGRLAKEIMTQEMPLVQEETDLAGVIASFLNSGGHRVIVVDAEGYPVGLISDSDVVGRLQPAHRRGILGALRGGSSLPKISVTARELMSPGVETISGETSVVDAIQKMLTVGRKWLVVVDDQGKPVGLIDREIALEALIR